MIIYRKMAVEYEQKFFIECMNEIWAMPMINELGKLWRCFVVLGVMSMIAMTVDK